MTTPDSYEQIAERALKNAAFREGLLAAAAVARAQDTAVPGVPPCPVRMAAIYIENLADGELP